MSEKYKNMDNKKPENFEILENNSHMQNNIIHPAFADKSEGSGAHSDDDDGRDGRIVHDDDSIYCMGRPKVL